MAEIYKPQPYQTIGAQLLYDNPRCQLWMKPGMGKSSTVLALFDLLKLAGSNFFPALIIAPLRVARKVWSDEIQKWSRFNGLTLTKILGDKTAREAAIRGPKTDIYTINYENLPWLIAALGGKWPFKIVVADESTRLKNFRLSGGGMRAHELAKIAKHTGRWINLSGTPASNGLKDLWGQTWFCDFGERLGRSFTKFTQRWFYEDPYAHTIVPHAHSEKEIHEALKDISFAFRPEDWFTFETPRVSKIEVEMPEAAQAAYDEMEDNFFVEMGEHLTPIEALNEAAKSMKLLQMASGAVYDAGRAVHEMHTAKVEGLRGIVEELNEPLLVAYYFKFTPDRIRKDLPDVRVMDSDQDIEDWNAGKIPVMLVHYQSAGHGISLQYGGRALCYFDQIWDMELRDQVLERLGSARQAQSKLNRVVLVYDLIAKGTIDQDVLDRHESKRSVQDALLLARARRRH